MIWRWTIALLLTPILGLYPSLAQTQDPVPSRFQAAFVNFETAPVHPIALSPDQSQLVVANLPDGRLEIFDVTSGHPIARGAVPVGIDPVSVRFRNETEVWVVNHISDSISVVDLTSLRVTATIDTQDTPADVVFAGTPVRAFVSCMRPNVIQVLDPISRQGLTNIVVEAERPRSLVVSADGLKVYAAIFESGNRTTLIGARFRNLLFFSNVVSLASGPYDGQNPPPNSGSQFEPPLNPALPAALPIPATGLIVRKNTQGRWLDDNLHDWTEFVSGTNATLTQRVPGWDLPDRDVIVLDTTDYSISYASGLMNLCMALAINPASGKITVVGTDATNERRFEPNLNGTFARVQIAQVDPVTLESAVKDLNPHLDYVARSLPPSERDKSMGDPRDVTWTGDGQRGYVAGMGSRNVVLVDSQGDRLPAPPIELGEGPCGLALDEARQRLYVYHRFSSSLSVVDTVTGTALEAVALFDPTPVGIAAGRRHLYDTRRTSGLGQASCASCHVDGRMDRLSWDLGNPAGDQISTAVNHQSAVLVTNHYHPMKGVMLTQTLQDIIGHEPFHWRGDRPDIESFQATFTNLQAAVSAPTTSEMHELREFLASIRFPPNPYRLIDNSLSTNVPLPGHTALGDHLLPAGAPLPPGNAAAGLQTFNLPANFCVTCHALPTGLGREVLQTSGPPNPIPIGPNEEHHFPLAVRLEGSLRSKIAQFRNLPDRVGMDSSGLLSRAGFGFGHDGSIDTLTRFLQGVRVVQDRDMADLIAFLLSVAGSDTLASGAGVTEDSTPPAAVGRQLTLASTTRPVLLDAMVALARSPTSRVDLVAKGMLEGLPRGWVFDRASDRFQSDRQDQSLSADDLAALAAPGSELTLTVVPRGAGVRIGIDRDLDGVLDRDEIDAGADPKTRPWRPLIVLSSTQIPFGTDVTLEARIPPMPATASIAWWKDEVPIAETTTASLQLTQVSFQTAGEYRVVVTTPFLASTSAPVRLEIVPLLATVSPPFQNVRRGSNVLLTAATSGLGPFYFQWYFDNQLLEGPATPSLLITNAQLTNEGYYWVTVTNLYGSATSAPVRLGLLVNPTLVVPPLSQSVIAGDNATFSVQISGHPPPFGYLLRKSTAILTNYSSIEPVGFLTLFNVQPTNSGFYRITITNAANPAPGLTLDPVNLEVLADSDMDGLPDFWETLHNLKTNCSADAVLDLDIDGLDNLQEYTAGTDPRIAASVLAIDHIVLTPDGEAVVVEFEAASNRTYSLQSHEAVPFAGSWTREAGVVAFPTNRQVILTNAIGNGPMRFYRVVTPYQGGP